MISTKLAGILNATPTTPFTNTNSPSASPVALEAVSATLVSVPEPSDAKSISEHATTETATEPMLSQPQSLDREEKVHVELDDDTIFSKAGIFDEIQGMKNTYFHEMNQNEKDLFYKYARYIAKITSLDDLYFENIQKKFRNKKEEREYKKIDDNPRDHMAFHYALAALDTSLSHNKVEDGYDPDVQAVFLRTKKFVISTMGCLLPQRYWCDHLQNSQKILLTVKKHFQAGGRSRAEQIIKENPKTLIARLCSWGPNLIVLSRMEDEEVMHYCAFYHPSPDTYQLLITDKVVNMYRKRGGPLSISAHLKELTGLNVLETNKKKKDFGVSWGASYIFYKEDSANYTQLLADFTNDSGYRLKPAGKGSSLGNADEKNMTAHNQKLYEFSYPPNFNKLSNGEQARWQRLESYFNNILQDVTTAAVCPAEERIQNMLNILHHCIEDCKKYKDWHLCLEIKNLDRALRDSLKENPIKFDPAIIKTALQQMYKSCCYINYKYQPSGELSSLEEKEQAKRQERIKFFDEIVKVVGEFSTGATKQIEAMLAVLHRWLISCDLQDEWPAYLQIKKLDRELRTMMQNNARNDSRIIKLLEQISQSYCISTTDWEAKASMQQKIFKDRIILLSRAGWFFQGTAIMSNGFVDRRLEHQVQPETKNDNAVPASPIPIINHFNKRVERSINRFSSFFPADSDTINDTSYLILEYLGVIRMGFSVSSVDNYLVLKCLNLCQPHSGYEDYTFRLVCPSSLYYEKNDRSSVSEQASLYRLFSAKPDSVEVVSNKDMFNTDNETVEIQRMLSLVEEDPKITTFTF